MLHCAEMIDVSNFINLPAACIGESCEHVMPDGRHVAVTLHQYRYTIDSYFAESGRLLPRALVERRFAEVRRDLMDHVQQTLRRLLAEAGPDAVWFTSTLDLARLSVPLALDFDIPDYLRGSIELDHGIAFIQGAVIDRWQCAIPQSWCFVAGYTLCNHRNLQNDQ